MKKHSLGEVVLSFPDRYSLEDGKDSVVARSFDGAEVQVSAISLLKARALVPGAGRAYVENRGVKEGRSVTRGSAVSWFSLPDNAGEGKTGSLWYAGIETHVVIVTTTVRAGQPQIVEALERDVLEIVGALKIASVNA